MRAHGNPLTRTAGHQLHLGHRETGDMMPDNRRRNLRSDTLSTWMVNNDADATLLTTRITEGPATIQDRYVTTRLTDDELISVIAKMALWPRWAAGLTAIGDDPAVKRAIAENSYFMNGSSNARALATRMRAAMDRYDEQELADAGQ